MDEVVQGTLARVIQHEYDHLQGVLFPDRMSEAGRKSLQAELDAFDLEFQALLKQDEGLQAAHVKKRLAALESEYCQSDTA
jgi:peptide deformylase